MIGFLLIASCRLSYNQRVNYSDKIIKNFLQIIKPEGLNGIKRHLFLPYKGKSKESQNRKGIYPMSTQSSLVDKEAAKIEKKIIKGDYKPGDKLPNELILSRDLGISRSTLREVMKLLSTRNVVIVKRGIGTFISDTPGRVDDPLGIKYLSENDLIIALDFLDVRAHLEPWIAYEAAQHATPENLEEMKDLCSKTELAIHSNKDHLETDREFHTAIAKASGNSIVPSLIPIICQGIEKAGNATSNKLKEETIKTHKEIVVAIENHDSVAAYNAMQRHIEMNQVYIRGLQKKQ